jgi:hypothetical protein
MHFLFLAIYCEYKFLCQKIEKLPSASKNCVS